MGRESPRSQTLLDAFQRHVVRKQRRTAGGMISIDGKRFEIPARYRHLEQVHFRYAPWDLRQVSLMDPQNQTLLCRLFPLDKSANATSLRCTLPLSLDKPLPPKPTGMAPMLKDLIAAYATTGLPPAYLPKVDKEFTDA